MWCASSGIHRMFNESNSAPTRGKQDNLPLNTISLILGRPLIASLTHSPSFSHCIIGAILLEYRSPRIISLPLSSSSFPTQWHNGARNGRKTCIGNVHNQASCISEGNDTLTNTSSETVSGGAYASFSSLGKSGLVKLHGLHGNRIPNTQE